MFTGIVKKIGVIESWDKNSQTIGIKSGFKRIKLGESIACSGVCLTVSAIKSDLFFCNVSPETNSKTNLKEKKIGDFLNLERSLKIGDDLSGHLVFGHVDGTCVLTNIEKMKDSWKLKFKLKKELQKYLTNKCSITIDGISLTVNETFQEELIVTIVPFTWENTILKFSKKGDRFNVEIDMIARYVFKALNK